MDPRKIANIRAHGYHVEADRVERGMCPFCDVPVVMAELRNDLARREAETSGLCQSCQDEVFGAADAGER